MSPNLILIFFSYFCRKISLVAMELFKIFSVILVLSAIFAFINHKFIKLPSTISLMIAGLLLSFITLVTGNFYPLFYDFVQEEINMIDFSELVLEFMLSFLLFAGALHTDYIKLSNARGPVLSFATIGVILSTVITATVTYFLLQIFGFEIEYIYCLLFGALISPTDPIAVLGILRKEKIPKSLEVKITGESLFNDGVGVVIFLSLLHIAEQGGAIDASFITELLLLEILGGVGLGIGGGYLALQMMKRIDHYQTEVLITLALVTGAYSLALALHFSGPLAMVLAGLIIGNQGKKTAMSEQTLEYVDKFWEMVDEILNAVLFVLIGLEILILSFKWVYLALGLIAALLIVLIRYLSLLTPSVLLGYKRAFAPNALKIMTWGGLKGGISIALALSLTSEMPRDLILSMTYVVVIFSLLVQGLTIGKLVNKYKRESKLG